MHAGSVINIPTLKKSQKRKSGYPIRGRSQFPSRPNSPPDLGQSRLPAGNPQPGAAQHPQNLWNHRIIPRSIPLPFSRRLQRADLYSVSRKDTARLLSSENLSYSGQRLLSQRPYRGIGFEVIAGMSKSSISPPILQSSMPWKESGITRVFAAHTTDIFRRRQNFDQP